MFESVTNIIRKVLSKNKNLDDTVWRPVHPDALAEYNAVRPNGPKSTLCYAPFKSLYFGHGGKVYACCYNRQYILGTIPEETIEEIWFGQKADKLRNYIKHNDLTLGCGGCDNLFTAKNFDAVKASMYDHYPELANRFPSLMEFELSNICNLECIMCSGEFSSSIRKNRERMPVIPQVYGSKFVEQLKKFIPWLSEVKFYGGEPFMVDIYYEIWDQIILLNPSCKISVQTNATTLNSRLKALLERKNFDLNISLDSLNKEKYESIRINARFESVMENIEYFRKYAKEKNTFLGISCCAMRDNWRELPDFITFCNEREVPVYFHTVWGPVERTLWNLDSATLLEIYEYLEQFTFPQSSVIERKNYAHYIDTLNLIRNWQAAAVIREKELNQFAKGVSNSGAKQDLYNQIKEYFDKDIKLSDEAKKQKTLLCFSNITGFVSVLPPGYSIDKIWDYIKALPIEKLVHELELNRQEHIVKGALSDIFNLND